MDEHQTISLRNVVFCCNNAIKSNSRETEQHSAFSAIIYTEFVLIYVVAAWILEPIKGDF
jgi:hypothetical protein